MYSVYRPEYVCDYYDIQMHSGCWYDNSLVIWTECVEDANMWYACACKLRNLLYTMFWFDDQCKQWMNVCWFWAS